jgi:hypothetical protein
VRPATCPGLSESGDRDTQSISDLLKERQSQFAFDLGIVMDAKGNVLGRNDQTEAFRESLADDPLVRPAIAKAAPFSGYWRQGDRLYQAAIMPLQQDQTLVGFILLAQTINNEFCQQVAKISGAADRVLAARESHGWSEWERARGRWQETGPAGNVCCCGKFVRRSTPRRCRMPSPRMQRCRHRHRKPLPRRCMTFSGQRWIAKLTPTQPRAKRNLGSLLALTSIDRIVASYRDILNWVLVGGVASILIALLLSYLLAKGILRPVRTMALAAEQAAAGNYKTNWDCAEAMSWRVCRARSIRCCPTCAKRATWKATSATCRASCLILAPNRPAQRRRPGRSRPRANRRAWKTWPLRTRISPVRPARRCADSGSGVEPLRERRSSSHANCHCGRWQHADTARASLRTDFRRTGPADSGPAGVVRAARSVARRWCRPAAAALVSGEAIQGAVGADAGLQPALLGPVMLQMDRLLPEAAVVNCCWRAGWR